MKDRKWQIIIMAVARNMFTLRSLIPYIKKNINVLEIIIIAKKDMKQDIESLAGVCFIDEDQVLEEMNLCNVQDILRRRCGKTDRAGWYFQQFLKMAWAYQCSYENYVVWDSDTFPLNPIDFMESGKYVFTPKNEYNEAYFSTIHKLFAGKITKTWDYSFIAEHMIFNCQIMKEMIHQIERNQELPGIRFYEKILSAVPDGELLRSGFSEFETYGSYMSVLHPHGFLMRPLRTLREGVQVLGLYPTPLQLDWAGRDFDIITIEYVEKPRKIISFFTRFWIVRKTMSACGLVRTRNIIRSFYRKILHKRDCRYD